VGKFRGPIRVIKAARRVKDSESGDGETGSERRRSSLTSLLCLEWRELQEKYLF
jgi:hypothetical protein